MTEAMRYILRVQSTYCAGAACWVSFAQDDEHKRQALADKWAEQYGTRLPPEKRSYRVRKGLPVAWALDYPVLHDDARHVMLLTQPHALKMPKESPFARERWHTRQPEIADLFVMARLPGQDGAYRWTWRIQQRQLAVMEQHIKGLVLNAEAGEIKECVRRWVSLYPMFFGVRQQFRRLLNSAQKLYVAKRKSTWPTYSADTLPAMVGFVKDNAVKKDASPASKAPSKARPAVKKDASRRAAAREKDGGRRAAKISRQHTEQG